MGCSASTEADNSAHRTTGYPKQQYAQQQPHPQQQQHYQQQQQPQHYQQQPQHQQQQQPPQQQRPPPEFDAGETDIEVKPVPLDRKTVERYLELERQIHQLEGKNVLRSLKVKQDELVDLQQTVQQLQQHYEACVQKTEKEKRDVDNMMMPSVKGFFKQQQDYDAKLSKEQEEYLDALNEQEIAQKQLNGVIKQRDNVAREVEDMGSRGKTLQNLYQEQDELLAGIFDGKYGSTLENKLEMELDALLDKKQRVGVARVKWQNGRVLLQHAVNQLTFAVRRWGELLQVHPSNTQVRYTMATETRNNLIAANQNITSAQRYLHTIQFPYCKNDEMQTLSRAVNNIYTDMQTQSRYAHALDCYSTTCKRAAALLQWFDHVINNTIAKDQQQSNTDVAAKYKALRAERLQLMKAKIRESGGDVNIEDTDMHDDDDSDQELIALALEADNVSQAGDLSTGQESEVAVASTAETGGGGQGAAPTPLPLNELAPAPDTEDLFGNINELKEQHEKEMAEFSKAQETNKARMDQGLQEKLRARRSRRRRQEIHEEQMS